MDLTEKLLAVATGLFGGGWLSQVLLLRYERRKKRAEAHIAEVDADEKYERVQEHKLSRAYDQIVELQGIVDTERGKWVELARKVSALKAELLIEKEARRIAEYDKCKVRVCHDRKPPRSESYGTAE